MLGDPSTQTADPLGAQPAQGEVGAEDQKAPGEPSFKDKVKPEDDESDEARSRRAFIERWQKKIKDAKKKWCADFDRMKANMDFVAGLQWKGQKKIDHDQYVVNVTLRTINQRVATLYARNPKVKASRRPRLDFSIWDGKMETILQAVEGSMMALQSGMPVPPQAMAMLNDYQAGKQRQEVVQKVGETLEKVYQYQQDIQSPRFKVQMKQLVRRVSVCGVGYIKVQFCRDYENELTQSATRLSLIDRAKSAMRILEKVKDGKVQESDADMEKLRQLLASVKETTADDIETVSVKEHLIFDFPKSTSIIPDENCSIIRGFVGAKWIVEEFKYPLEFVNSMFEKNIKPGTQIKEYGPDGQGIETAQTEGQKSESTKNKVTLWEVSDLESKITFIIADGYKEFLMKPEVVTPSVRGFWTIVPVTFNDVEVIDECDATIFPPSDVDLIKHPQIQINRSRNSQNRHRIANRPRAMYPEGALTEEDLDKIASSEDNEMVPLKGLQPGTEPGKVMQPLLMTPYDENLYHTEQYQEDLLQASGTQEANIGPAQPNVTATVGTIAEQSRMTVAASDIDSLDDSLTDVAQIGGELLLREMSSETVKRIVGIGAVWPEQNKEDFLNEIELEVEAASSGKPNKAVDIANWERLVPLIMQAATMPPQAQPTMQAIIRETIKRFDDNMEPAEFFPLPMPMMQPQDQQPQGGQPSRPQNQPKPRQRQQSVPLAGQRPQ